MGFASNDALINALTVNGTYSQYNWNKQTPGSAYTAGRWYDLSQLAGSPVANAYTGTALAAQVPTESTGFGMPHGGNVSTLTKHILNISAVTAVATGVPSTLLLVDMCLYYPQIAMNSATRQTLDNTNTLTRYTNGVGLRSFLAISTVVGTGAHNIDNTASTGTAYTNTAATVKEHPGTIACTASAIVTHLTHSGSVANNVGPFLPLAAGDVGITNYTHFKLTAAPASSGKAALVICKPLVSIPLTTTSVGVERDLLNQIPSMPRVMDGACLTWLLFTGAAVASSTNYYGSTDFVWN